MPAHRRATLGIVGGHVLETAGLQLRGPEPASGFSGSRSGSYPIVDRAATPQYARYGSSNYDIAISAKSFLLDPVLLIVPIVLVLAIMTGVVGRSPWSSRISATAESSVEADDSHRTGRPTKETRGPAGWTTGEWILLVRCAANLHRLSVSSGSANTAGDPRLNYWFEAFVPKPALTTTPTASAPAATAKSGISGRR